jgi:hypothetical protein
MWTFLVFCDRISVIKKGEKMENSREALGGGESGEVESRANFLGYYFGISGEAASNPVFQREFFKHAMWLEGEENVAAALRSIEAAERGDMGGAGGVAAVRRLAGGPERIRQFEGGQVVIAGEAYRPDGISQCRRTDRIKMLDDGEIAVYNHCYSVVSSASLGLCGVNVEVGARGYDKEGKLRSYAKLDNHDTADKGTLISDVDFSGLEDFDSTENGATVDMIDICPDVDATGEPGNVRYHIQRDRSVGDWCKSGVGSLFVEDGLVMLRTQEGDDETAKPQICLNDVFGSAVAGEFYEAIYG